MAGTSHAALVMMSMMPVLGVGLLVVVLLAMALNRDRWIVPGSIAVIIAASGWTAAVEYGPQARELLARTRMPARVATAPQPVQTENTGQEAPAAATPAPREAPAPLPKPEREKPASSRMELVPLDEGRRAIMPEERETTRDGRRTVVVNPVAQPTYEPPARTDQPARPTPAPTPAPRPIAAPPAPVTRAAPAPAPTTFPSAPALQPASAPASGHGTLIITVRGPLVETSQTPVRSPNLLAILDGKKVDTAAPTRTTEAHQNNNSSGALLAVTYFWENVTFTFPNLEAGWHVVMLDTGLDDPRAHQARMIGTGQDQNDYNGAVEIKAGQTTHMDFGAKNFMTGKLPPPSIH